MYATDYNSPLGEMLMVSDGESICGAWFYGQKHFPKSEFEVNDNLTVFKDAIVWLDSYFRGENPEIDFKLSPHGSEFRLKVWKILSQIEYGKTVTYGEIARIISPSMSAQAVGGAVARNPISILIPCHRVVGAGGKLTGYAGGIARKTALLKLENII